MPASVKKCDCEHKYQDKKHGKGNRVHNQKADGDWTCTVCTKKKEGKKK